MTLDASDAGDLDQEAIARRWAIRTLENERLLGMLDDSNFQGSKYLATLMSAETSDSGASANQNAAVTRTVLARA